LIDLAGWATNWQIRSRAVRTRDIQTSITRSTANAFANNMERGSSVKMQSAK
jgi:hypothetical protein